VAFELPTDGQARLEIVDLRGRRVAVLHDGPLTAGRHELEWRGRDQDGVGVAGGVYLARLVTAGGSRTVKLSLAK
jgi:flagellar hook assembly protein FlgD